MENDLLQQLTEKLQSIGMTKQHFFNKVSQLFVEGKIDINGTSLPQTDYREQTRDDFDFNSLKEAFLKDSDFVSALSEKIANDNSRFSEPVVGGCADSGGDNDENEAVNSSQTTENETCNVPDYVIDKLRSLPSKLSNSALEKALGIPSTYLSKRGNKSVERKLEEYKDYLSALTPPNGTDKKWTNPLSSLGQSQTLI